jgi:hypothetical protein
MSRMMHCSTGQAQTGRWQLSTGCRCHCSRPLCQKAAAALSGLLPIDAARGNIHCKRFPGIRIEPLIGQEPVLAEKDQSRCQCRALVAIHERATEDYCCVDFRDSSSAMPRSARMNRIIASVTASTMRCWVSGFCKEASSLRLIITPHSRSTAGIAAVFKTTRSSNS